MPSAEEAGREATWRQMKRKPAADIHAEGFTKAEPNQAIKTVKDTARENDLHIHLDKGKYINERGARRPSPQNYKRKVTKERLQTSVSRVPQANRPLPGDRVPLPSPIHPHPPEVPPRLLVPRHHAHPPRLRPRLPLSLPLPFPSTLESPRSLPLLLVEGPVFLVEPPAPLLILGPSFREPRFLRLQ